MTSDSTAPTGTPDAPRFRALLPEPAADVDLAAAYAYPSGLEGPWLRANMVASADGGAWGPSGRTAELSSPPDRALMSVLRAHADVVLAGAATARIEGYRPVRPREVWGDLRAGRTATPPLALVTRTLDVHPDVLEKAPPEAPTIVFTTESAPADRRRAAAASGAEVVVAGADSVRPEEVLAGLAERGLVRVLTEGGPHLLAEFAAAGLLDELCLTLSPRLLGPAAARIVAGAAPSHTQDLRLAAVLESEDSLFVRYRRAFDRTAG
ncbi:dihydrofolate reductase family protein [Streptomonospora nanhaiensis]|uniref:dihydrofolate reductase family protein n=1 Tax=Streptomonospora nanhaiensis TaxID=1323731 RepID=UPI001C383291|nr:dihydrofolate reductase family protein [Streptomonospora nanhaiensis]MBV2366137.1 dihydrofolate reductase family protein [Streptomonospora nanhaiensis]MBX9390222.1 dihydrofolate reductase family protein [Streptomonospora nanhaiensis]